MRDDKMEFTGTVIDHCKDIFRIQISENSVVQAKISGRMRMNKINVTVGDVVKVEVSPYDTSRGRIVSRVSRSAATAVDTTR